MIRKTLIDQTQLLVLQLCVITSSDRSSLDTETAKHIIVSGSATCFVWLMCCDSYWPCRCDVCTHLLKNN